MSLKNCKIGVFPRSIDGLMISNLSLEVVYLVIQDSLEERWVKDFLNPEKISTYNIDKKYGYLTNLNTEDILKYSNITRIIKANNIEALLITHRCTDYINTWGRKNGIKIISTSYEQQRKFEDKLWFDKFLDTYYIPKPKSAIYNYKRRQKLPICNKAILQERNSFGSKGSFFVKSNQDITDLIQAKKISPNRDYLIRRFVKGKTYGITVFITSGIVALSSIRLQCFYPQNSVRERVFAGIQWVPSNRVGVDIKKKINKFFLKIGRILYDQHFFGYANFDFIINNKGNIYVIECNPRLSSATIQLIKFPELVSGIQTGNIFLEALLDNKSYESQVKFYEYPTCNFGGSLLDLVISPQAPEQKFSIKKEYDNGVYFLKNGKVYFKDPNPQKMQSNTREFLFYTEAKKGEVYRGNTTVASIVANFPIFNLNGKINREGRKLLNVFKY